MQLRIDTTHLKTRLRKGSTVDTQLQPTAPQTKMRRWVIIGLALSIITVLSVVLVPRLITSTQSVSAPQPATEATVDFRSPTFTCHPNVLIMVKYTTGKTGEITLGKIRVLVQDNDSGDYIDAKPSDYGVSTDPGKPGVITWNNTSMFQVTRASEPHYYRDTFSTEDHAYQFTGNRLDLTSQIRPLRRWGKQVYLDAYDLGRRPGPLKREIDVTCGYLDSTG